MSSDFFKLKGEFTRISTQDELATHMDRSDHLKDVLYEPPLLAPDRPKNIMSNKTFVNVSFSKTTIRGVNFRRCDFQNCLFIGTVFDHCEFHGCTFVDCNPYKARFTKTYINPAVFSKMLDPKSHSNIGIILFQQLLANSAENRQSGFAQSAEYYFRKWKRYQLEYEYRKKQISRGYFYRRWIPDRLYDLFAGYGLRTTPFLVWTVLLFSLILLVNHFLWPRFAMHGYSPGSTRSNWIVTFYYTVITISTLGYGDITPSSNFGMALAGIEALLGIVWLSILASIIIKKVVR